MKTKFSWLGIVAVCIILCVSSFLIGCENNSGEGRITYKGRVVSLTGNQPIADVTVSITNGTIVKASMVTQADGLFSLSVITIEINETYYLKLTDKNGVSKKGQLRAFGLAEYDYGDIPFGEVVPTVETTALTAMNETSFTCKCNVTSQGNARVTERGLCWGTNVPTIEDNVVPCGSGTGEYSCTVENAGININTTTYYARAYAKNDYGIAYGEPIEINSSMFAYFSLPTMQYAGYTYHIHPDLGAMQWEQANNACQNLVAYGFSDWYLPNKEELVNIGVMSSALQIGKFYWTSTTWGDYSNRHYYVIYNNDYNYWKESERGTNDSDVLDVVPVRKDR